VREKCLMTGGDSKLLLFRVPFLLACLLLPKKASNNNICRLNEVFCLNDFRDKSFFSILAISISGFGVCFVCLSVWQDIIYRWVEDVPTAINSSFFLAFRTALGAVKFY